MKLTINNASGILEKAELGNKEEFVVVPDIVTGIGDKAFCACGGMSPLIDVIIPESVTSIGNEAFADCKHLANITMP